IDDGVPRNREGQIGLALACALNAHFQKRASIQYGRERRDPGLVVVLRAKVSQDWIRKMAFHQLRGPHFPILEDLAEGVLSTLVAVPAQKLAGGGWGPSARVQQGDFNFALRERTVNERKIADDSGQEAETKAGFGDDQDVREHGAREHVAQAQGKKCRAAEIEIHPEAGPGAGYVDGRTRPELHQAKAQDQSDGPHAEKQQERNGTKKTQERFAGF